jgi:hypothetical protein
VHIRVELDLAVTSILGTVVIGRHLGGQLRAHFHLARTKRPTEHAASHVGSTFHHNLQFKSVSTLYTPSPNMPKKSAAHRKKVDEAVRILNTTT